MSRTIKTKHGDRIVFEVGDRVRLSEDGVMAHFQDPSVPAKGEVVGLARSSAMVRVLRDGIKTPYLYASAFWEIDE